MLVRYACRLAALRAAPAPAWPCTPPPGRLLPVATLPAPRGKGRASLPAASLPGA
eukprot:CAMPEP_0202786412 /NCGR_PEP_ID=MMETSP1388-20130828/70146_1 /ASSEMBLY_ACC=CAM_ASM_000864 /TAXON_ID=37098 /ORGANISM="Isochrysis sp, Strain CCMP1244" /LENGTH=54 /DNA_ID=CAMNT_0049455967 /DNA_START=398 /DNA_END=559 /DNA_ORIENTATION=+